MAEPQTNQENFFQQAASVFGKISEAVMRDGTIAAAGRQGVDELGMALKAFPDSIQAQEMGTIWSPTPGEIANARSAEPEAPLPSPSQIADGSMSDGKERNSGQVLTQGKWQDRINEERKGKAESTGNSEEGSYEPAKGRSLPDEQRQQEKERGSGGLCR